jgi:hypothetical protein
MREEEETELPFAADGDQGEYDEEELFGSEAVRPPDEGGDSEELVADYTHLPIELQAYIPNLGFPVDTANLLYAAHNEEYSTFAYVGQALPDSPVLVIPIDAVEGRLLIAVPEAAWSRSLTKRVLDSGALKGPVKLELALSSSEPLTTAVWIGIAAADFAARCYAPASTDENIAYQFVDQNGFAGHLPLAEALVSASQEHFATNHTGEEAKPETKKVAGAAAKAAGAAKSAAGKRGEKKVVPKAKAARTDPMEARVKLMEQQVALIHESLKAIRTPAPGGPASARAPPSTRPAGTVPLIAGLPPSAVKAAKEAGVTAEQLGGIAKLLSASPPRLSEYKLTAKKGPLSESEDEAEAAAVEELGTEVEPRLDAAAGAMGLAISQLTTVVTLLAEQKAPSKLSRLDRALDGLSGGAPAGSGEQLGGVMTTRRSQVALRELRRALVEEPEQIFSAIETNMAEDLPTPLPGAQVATTDSRVWLEHRSRIQHFPATIRWVRGVAGIHNRLKAGRVKEARARTALLLAAADQVAVDSGNWIVAAGMLFEPAPPFASFQSHRLPGATEEQHSRLLDPRWLEVAQARLRELEDFSVRKRKLNTKKGEVLPQRSEEDHRRNAASAKAKAEAKAKAGVAAAARRRREAEPGTE